MTLLAYYADERYASNISFARLSAAAFYLTIMV